MLLHNKSRQIYYILLCILALVIPTYFFLAPILIILLSVSWLLQLNAKQLVYNIKKNKALWALVIFYFLHIVGYFYSIDKRQGLFDLQQKLSFIVLPLVIGCGPRIGYRELENIFIYYVFGTTFAALECFTRAIIIWKHSGITSQFFYHNLVHCFSANAIYFSLYTLLSLSMLLLYPWSSKSVFKKKALYYAVIFIQILFYILLSSKTFLILLVVLIAPFYFKKILKQKSILKEQRFALVSLVIAIVFISSTRNPIRSRYEQIFQNHKMEYLLPDINNKDPKFNNLTLRLFIWRIAIENIKENNLWIAGCGIGDVKLYQRKKITSYDYKFNNDRSEPGVWEFNMHNQYLQTLFMLGVIGLISLLIIVLYPFYYVKDLSCMNMFLIFNISFLLLMLQESSFQTQAGIIYYVFFYCIFYNIWNSNVKNLSIGT